MSSTITIRGDFGSNLSYGQLVNSVAIGLMKQGVAVDKLEANSYKAAVNPGKDLIVYPPFYFEYRGYPPALTRLHLTMWESSILKPKWVEGFNQCSRLLVTNKWNRYNFIKDGVMCPISVIPLGIDPLKYNYQTPNDGPFTFGCAGDLRSGDDRKQIASIVKMFVKAFPSNKDVRLKVKVVGDFNRFTDPRIEVCRQYLTEDKLLAWYRSIHSFISLGTEGWGLMQHQSMACGKPLIAPAYAGLAEFFDDKAGFPVEFKEETAAKNFSEYGGVWAQYNEDSLISQMRHCLTHQDEVLAKGKAAATQAAIFSEENMINKLREALDCTV